MPELSDSCLSLPAIATALLVMACQPEKVRDHLPQRPDPVESAEGYSAASWRDDFPAGSDLAILLGSTYDAVITADTLESNGNWLLPESWLQSTSEAYYDTEVEDALELENLPEEWRIVSIRVTPCGPVGLMPSQDIDTLCWPAVRLVWQPVLEDFTLAWGYQTDFYADDRAIHAIYPLDPRDSEGNVSSTYTRDEVIGHLQSGNSHASVSTDLLDTFERERNLTALWLLDQVHNLRDPDLGDGSWNGIDLRPELFIEEANIEAFAQRLTSFLGEVAANDKLGEMTSFSLPEGRTPASTDIWVFIAFDGNGGNPSLKELTVIGRESGDELVNIGTAQSVAVGIEDPAVEEALAEGNQELEESLIISGSDILEMTGLVADPYEFLVPNTSCASCHRMNNALRFNFHALSGFETDGIFVSPRVEDDVARDIAWVQANAL